MGDAEVAKDAVAQPIELSEGTGIRLLVDDTVYAIKTVHPLENGQSVATTADEASDIELRPYAGEGRVKTGSDVTSAELQFVGPDHKDAVAIVPFSDRANHEPTPDENVAQFERDLAVRQLKVQQANLKVIQMALNENRPLEALYTVNNSLDELEEQIEALEADASGSR